MMRQIAWRRAASGRYDSAGFTLIELLVTIAVLAVLVAVALPNMRDFVVSNRLSSNVNGFVGLVNLARSEAIVRNQDVIICPKRASAIGCQSGSDWQTFELQAFVDVNGDGDRDAADVPLKILAAVDSGTGQAAFESSGDSVIFGSAGFARTARSFKIYAPSTDANYKARFGRTVCISKAGRVRVTAYTATSCPDF